MKILKTMKRWFGFDQNGAANELTNLWVQSRLLGPQTKSGVAMDENLALTIPAFLHGLRLFASVIGALDWNLIKHDGNKRSVDRSHPIHRLMHSETNDIQVPINFRETMIARAIAYGNSFAYIARDGRMRATSLVPMLSKTYPVMDGNDFYYVTYINNEPKKLNPENVFHLSGFSFNGITGVQLVRIMAQTLGLSKAEEDYAASYFGNGCNSGGVLEAPGKLSDEAFKHLKESIEDASGLEKAFKVMILEEGMKLSRSEADAEGAQLVQSRTFQITEICRVLGIPPHLLYELSRATFSNIEHQNIEAVTYSFKPWCKKIEQETNRKLLYESEKGIWELIIDTKPLLAGDSKTQAEKDQIRFNTGSISINEIREKDGLNPVEGGDTLFVNAACVPVNLLIARLQGELAQLEAMTNDPEEQEEIETDEEQDKADPVDDNTDPTPQGGAVIDDGPKPPAEMIEDVNTANAMRAIRPLAVDIFQRLYRRHAKSIESNFSKPRSTWLERHNADMRRACSDALMPLVSSLGTMQRQVNIDALVTRMIEDYSADLSKCATPDDLALMIEGHHSKIERFTNEVLQ